MKTNTKPKTTKKTRYALRLFVVGEGANSRAAQENLKRLQTKHPNCEFAIEIIDLDREPEMALAHGIFISPALQILEPKSGGIVYGNLSEEKILQQALNL